jgi:hypothetical protein
VKDIALEQLAPNSPSLKTLPSLKPGFRLGISSAGIDEFRSRAELTHQDVSNKHAQADC